MIIAIEGPNGAGKTTLWDALKSSGLLPQAEFITWMYGKGLDSEVERAALILQTYSPSKLVVTQRWSGVTDRVYSRLYKRSPLGWYGASDSEVRVLYIDVPTEVLAHRRPDRSPSELAYAKDLYAEELKRWNHRVLPGCFSTGALVYLAVEHVRRWCSEDRRVALLQPAEQAD